MIVNGPSIYVDYPVIAYKTYLVARIYTDAEGKILEKETKEEMDEWEKAFKDKRYNPTKPHVI